jgi:heat-inducible transcriptional repressor
VPSVQVKDYLGEPVDKERKHLILNTAIQHYIETAEPVGSKLLVDRYKFNLSSATIRSELNELEREGYLSHVHTSSGRVPTDKGYRFYVDNIVPRAKTAVPTQLQLQLQQANLNLQGVLANVSEVMSSLIDYTTIVLTPDLYQETLKTAHLILVDLDKVLVVLLHSAGINSEHLLQLSDKIDQENLDKIAKLLSRKLEGKPVYELNEDFVLSLSRELPDLVDELKSLSKAVSQLRQSNQKRQNLLTKGMSNMIKLPEFKNIELTQRVLSLLEESKVLVNVLTEFSKQSPCQVVIGQETNVESLAECSLIVSQIGHETEPQGVIGILGPKRMAYTHVLPMVQSVTQHINTHLQKGLL